MQMICTNTIHNYHRALVWRHDWRDRCDRGIVWMKTPQNGRVGNSRQGKGSSGDCFKMLKTIGLDRRESQVVSQVVNLV